jgi:hypothetical protein
LYNPVEEIVGPGSIVQFGKARHYPHVDARVDEATGEALAIKRSSNPVILNLVADAWELELERRVVKALAQRECSAQFGSSL